LTESLEVLFHIKRIQVCVFVYRVVDTFLANNKNYRNHNNSSNNNILHSFLLPVPRDAPQCNSKHFLFYPP
jgi:hypothetical protein